MSENRKITAYDKAVKLLSIRMHTSFELARKLKQKGFNDEDITQAIARLKDERYLNDENTAESYFNSLVNHKTFGYYGIKSKLLAKGIDGNLAEKLLLENLTLEKEEQIAKKYLEKNKKSGDKAALGLKMKGFRGEVISRIISKFSDPNSKYYSSSN